MSGRSRSATQEQGVAAEATPLLLDLTVEAPPEVGFEPAEAVGFEKLTSPAVFAKLATPQVESWATLDTPTFDVGSAFDVGSGFSKPEVPTRPGAARTVQRVLRVDVPPEPAKKGTWWMPAAEYRRSFQNMVAGMLKVGRPVNFEEARQAQADLLRFPKDRIVFLALPLVDETDLQEEHKPTVNGWEQFVEMSLHLRDFLYESREQLVAESAASSIEEAMVWAGLTPSNEAADRAIVFDELGKPDADKTGVLAALIDLTLFRFPNAFGTPGAALDKLGYKLAGFDGFPRFPIENMVFAHGLAPGTETQNVALLDQVPNRTVDAAVLEGAYRIDSVLYESAFGLKRDRTPGTVIGWRQLRMVPIYRQVDGMSRFVTERDLAVGRRHRVELGYEDCSTAC